MNKKQSCLEITIILIISVFIINSTVWSQSYFKLGSTRDELLSVQGAPDSVYRYPAFNYELLYYSNSVVKISTLTNKVIEWDDHGNNLKVKSEINESTISLKTTPADSLQNLKSQIMPSDSMQFYIQLMPLLGHSDDFDAYDFQSNNKYLATGSVDNTVIIWDIEKRHMLHKLTMHTGEVRAVKFFPHRNYLASGGEDGKVIVWDITNGSIVRTLNTNKRITAIDFDKTGRFLFVKTFGDKVCVYDAESTNKLGEIEKGPLTLQFPNDLIIISYDRESSELEVESVLNRLCEDDTIKFKTKRYSPDKHWTFSISNNNFCLENVIYKNDWKHQNNIDSTIVYEMAQTPEKILDFALSPDEKYLAYGSKMIRIFNIETGNIKNYEIEDSRDEIGAMMYSPNGKWLAVAFEGYPRFVEIYNMNSNQIFQIAKKQIVKKILFSDDSKLIGIHDREKNFAIWDLHSQKFYRNFSINNTDSLSYYGFGEKYKKVVEGDDYTSASGKYDIYTSSHGNITVVNNTLEYPNNSKKLGEHGSNIIALAMSPDERYLATGGFNNLIKIWDLSIMHTIHYLQGHASNIRAITFNKNGNILISASQDGNIIFWDYKQGKQIVSLWFVKDKTDWFAITPNCLFDGTKNELTNLICVKLSRSNIMPLKNFWGSCYRPNLLKKILQEENIEPPDIKLNIK